MNNGSRKRRYEVENDTKTQLEDRLSKINVDAEDKRKSREIVANMLEKITQRFDDNTIFSKVYRKSGSYATGTKIISADEFDYDIPLKESMSYNIVFITKFGKHVSFVHYTGRSF